MLIAFSCLRYSNHIITESERQKRTHAKVTCRFRPSLIQGLPLGQGCGMMPRAKERERRAAWAKSSCNCTYRNQRCANARLERCKSIKTNQNIRASVSIRPPIPVALCLHALMSARFKATVRRPCTKKFLPEACCRE